MTPIDPDQRRASSRESWEQAASGWGRAADKIRDWAIEVSATMVDALALQPGQRVLELAAGPGDTGFMAAELIVPGGKLICSDGAEAMVDVARGRASAQGVTNVEFRVLELEWIDLPTADVDAVLCRWGIMLTVDPSAAAHEIRRVLKPGGRAALAVWDAAERNPWATIASDALTELGYVDAPEPDEPGMFALAGSGALVELLLTAGLLDIKIAPVALERRFDGVDHYIAETLQMSTRFNSAYRGLTVAQQGAVRRWIARSVRSYKQPGGSLVLPGSSLVAVAAA